MELNALNKYLEATQDHLGVEGERYGGGFRAIVAHRSATDFLFDMLEGDDFRGTETQAFLGENPLFPSARGATPQEALQRLDAKIGILYQFEPSTGAYKWEARRRFVLQAQYDGEPDEARSCYDVSWLDIVQDLRSKELYYYESAKSDCGESVKRDLHALITFKYEGEFASLIDLA
ncbi:hypothetical protein [Pseudomonas savastanoi]|uniref:hypothetical protein n=1 Tax=Pseudomonas savastanoi TaxID=29438 RepID=UPI00177E41CA|nr:hypothetical protein [Pseudomonas savastanoi]QOI07911.1 hypothetical protein D5S10_29755 [Pseudomonas savastanoi]